LGNNSEIKKKVVKKCKFFLLVTLIGLGVWFYQAFNTAGYKLFIKPDVGGHGHGYLYYDHGLWTRRVQVGYEAEILLWDADLSPDGSKIAFRKDLVLNIYDLHTKQLTQLSLEPNVPLGSVSTRWSPDGSRIGFPCQYAYQEPVQLCAWDLAKGELETLADLQAYGDYSSLSFGGWSADGSSLALVLSYPGEESWDEFQRILVVDTGTGQVRMVLDAGQAELHIYATIALSPDGKTILFSANTFLEERNKERTCALYRVDVDGGGLQRLVDRERISFLRPVWSPDGSAFYVNASNYYTFLPVRFDLSGRMTGLLPFQLGRLLLSWRSAE
jgi:Tol biopolymer transport system component